MSQSKFKPGQTVVLRPTPDFSAAGLEGKIAKISEISPPRQYDNGEWGYCVRVEGSGCFILPEKCLRGVAEDGTEITEEDEADAKLEAQYSPPEKGKYDEALEFLIYDSFRGTEPKRYKGTAHSGPQYSLEVVKRLQKLMKGGARNVTE